MPTQLGRLSFLLLSALAFTSCTRPDPSTQTSLIECSPSIYDDFINAKQRFGFNPLGEVILWPVQEEPVLRSQLLSMASTWAKDHCYLPCGQSMCAIVVRLPHDRAAAYIRPSLMPELGIYPEAHIVLELPTMAIVEELKYHSPWPCREFQKQILWKHGSCPVEPKKNERSG